MREGERGVAGSVEAGVVVSKVRASRVACVRVEEGVMVPLVL